ncbi:hypothetical protein TNCV_4346811 [Trichonephila clavipes]|nr:hypothetical protein TNCV_4346811 [Trichonephila clavipes]
MRTIYEVRSDGSTTLRILAVNVVSALEQCRLQVGRIPTGSVINRCVRSGFRSSSLTNKKLRIGPVLQHLFRYQSDESWGHHYEPVQSETVCIGRKSP